MTPNLRAPSEIFRARLRTRPRCTAFPGDRLCQHIKRLIHSFHKHEHNNLFFLCRHLHEVDCATKPIVTLGWLTCAVLPNLQKPLPSDCNPLHQLCLRLDPIVRASGHVTWASTRVQVFKDTQMCFSQSRLPRMGTGMRDAQRAAITR